MKELIVIYTICDDDTRQAYFNSIYERIPAYWTMLPLFAFTNNKKIDLNNSSNKPDILFVNDRSTGIDLKKADLTFDKLYVVHHKGSRNRIKSSDFPEKIVWTVEEHHSSGQCFDYLKQLSNCFNNDNEKYIKTLSDIINIFPDPVFEAALYLNKHLTILSLLKGKQFTDHKSKYLDTESRTEDNTKYDDSKSAREITDLLNGDEINNLTEGFEISGFLEKFNDYMNKYLTRNQK